MSRRPQRNPRRGILRAAAAVVVLVILLLLAILITASLTAPPATAPTVPSTPGPSTLAPQPSPTSALKSRKAKPSPTATHKKLAADIGSRSRLRHGLELSDRGRGAPASAPTPASVTNEVFSPDGRVAAYFMKTGTAYSWSPLFIHRAGGHASVKMGAGDALQRPVWSPDGRSFLYVRVDQIAAFPRARWTLLRLDLATRHTQVLDRQKAVALEPLGWSHGRILYLVVGSTDTSLYAFVNGRRTFTAIMMPQAVTSALLSPDGRYVAFAAPTNCSPCTLDVYDLDDDTVGGGPSGLSDETAMTWSVDGSRLVAALRGRLATIDPASVTTHLYALPPGLPKLSLHPLRVRASDREITLRDMVTGRTYRSSA